MCMQCDTDAVMVKENVLPGFSLMMAMVSARGWNAGEYALVISDDPCLIFRRDPIPDEGDYGPAHRLNMFTEAMRAAEDDAKARMGMFSTWKLVQAMVEAGYNPEKDGSRAAWWLIDHIGKVIKEYENA